MQANWNAEVLGGRRGGWGEEGESAFGGEDEVVVEGGEDSGHSGSVWGAGVAVDDGVACAPIGAGGSGGAVPLSPIDHALHWDKPSGGDEMGAWNSSADFSHDE